ncbi:hypothetical protein P43SY_010048 [Pythium insidiosum]|uniref:Uncharacterized protein n=1 Tax=Pythium insidiosum TaxID=114742 RepID=A0AAD5M404_PYTIN|nr:hypothetical protein P43SY_010048 [Pythium insidiosum]
MAPPSTASRLLYVLSPAKTLDLSATTVQQCSVPAMLSDAHALVTELRKLSQSKLKALLGVSDAIAKLNHDRFKDFEFVTDKAAASLQPNDAHKQAVLSFNGPAYQGLAASELSDEDLTFAQRHLRILCGLYGVLRPLDLIQAYRLEMGQKFATARGKDLYAFWGSTIAHEISDSFEQLAQMDESKAGSPKILVNVASQEYFKSIVVDSLDKDIQIIECVFKDDGKIKSVYAKRARGLMCRYLIEQRVETLDGIKKFDLEGYKFSAKESDDSTFVYNRTAAKQKEVLKEIQAKAKLSKAGKQDAGGSSGENASKKHASEDPKEQEEQTGVSTRKRRRVRQ